jgi:hypothetical protein
MSQSISLRVQSSLPPSIVVRRQADTWKMNGPITCRSLVGVINDKCACCRPCYHRIKLRQDSPPRKTATAPPFAKKKAQNRLRSVFNVTDTMSKKFYFSRSLLCFHPPITSAQRTLARSAYYLQSRIAFGAPRCEFPHFRCDADGEIMRDTKELQIHSVQPAAPLLTLIDVFELPANVNLAKSGWSCRS